MRKSSLRLLPSAFYLPSPALHPVVDKIPAINNSVKMKNITVSVEDEIYHRARVAAAERKTSVSALVREHLIAVAMEEAEALIHSWKRFPILPLSVENLEAALAGHQRWQLSYCDAAIVEAAREAKCETLLSADLNPGQYYGGVRVINPFLED